MARIIVVEDELALREDMVEHLESCGHDVRGAESGQELNDLMAEQRAEILILDVNLPGGEDGFRIASRLRRDSEVGIIMLTARGMSVDRIVGLELGADVYLVKPVDFREIQAQVGTLTRRMQQNTSAAPAPVLVVDEGGSDVWAFDPLGWSLTAPNGNSIKLTANETRLMDLLTIEPGQPVTREQIYQALGKRFWNPGDRSIDSMVRRLRTKVEEELNQPLPVQAVHAVGYTFTAPASRSDRKG